MVGRGKSAECFPTGVDAMEAKGAEIVESREVMALTCAASASAGRECSVLQRRKHYFNLYPRLRLLALHVVCDVRLSARNDMTGAVFCHLTGRDKFAKVLVD